jgi:drug/metabolite transporter (DMT)-like permease
MTPVALALVLVSAVAHATWNLFAKRAGGGALFIWLFEALAALLYAPLALAVIITQRPHIGALGFVFLAGSVLLHLVYFLVLQRGYRAGDLSLVYPLARGTGPTLSTATAIVLFGERPTPLAIAGAVLVAVSVVILVSGPQTLGAARGGGAGWAIGYGLLTGVVIATYTLWDKHAVSALAIPPLLLNWGNDLGRALLLLPLALRRRAQVGALWRDHRGEALGVAILSPLSYILVLTALVFTPVSYVAPAREVSILIGAVLGARLLAEGDARRRLVAAGTMVLGVAALALG